MARKDKLYLIRDQSAVPCDPDAGWKEGDMVPDYVTSRADAQGSAADNNTRASWNDGNITTHGHQVSYVKTLGLGAKTKVDIQAVKLR